MNLFIDLDGCLGEIRYNGKIRLTEYEGNTCHDICEAEFKNPTIILDFLNEILPKYSFQREDLSVYILTNLPDFLSENAIGGHSEAKKKWCEKYVKFYYKSVIINKESYSKGKKANEVIESDGENCYSKNILLDDCMTNLLDGEEKGGIGFHVSSLLTERGKNEFKEIIRRK